MLRAQSVRRGFTLVAASALLFAWSNALLAAPAAGEPAVGPRSGAGQRHVSAATEGSPTAPPRTPAPKATEAEPAPEPHPSEPAEPAAQPEPERKPSATSHRKGRPPKTPRPTLPDGVAAPEPSDGVRRQVAGGPTADDLRAGKDDPQLAALHEAELVLFPRPLDGATPGWSWDIPAPVGSGQVQAETSGVPPAAYLPGPPGSMDAAVAQAEWLRSLTMPNLPVRLDPRVVKYLEFYRDSSQGQGIVKAWAKKAGRFTAALQAQLARAGLPTDLVWLSLIESGHNPAIHSPAGAAGLWQFIPSTARAYGLVVDRWVDERLDPRRSTEAAVRLLSDLYQRFGSWELAMAAYNMGQGGLDRAIRKFNTNDFWVLSRHEAGIPWETTLYVPKIQAMAIVMTNKRAFGIDRITPDPSESFDTVRVASGVLLSRVAAAAEVSASEIENLNPQYLVGRSPPTAGKDSDLTWPVAVPHGKGVVASQRLRGESGLGSKLQPYVVRFGDSAATIAASHGTSTKRIESLNGLSSSEALRQGTVLLVPRRAGGEKPSSTTGEEVVVVPERKFQYADRERVFFRVRREDTIADITRAFGVTKTELLAWNALDENARLQSGMMLQVYVAEKKRLDRIRHTKARETRVLVAGSTEFFDYFEGQKGKKRLLVTVKRGESLSSIGRRYGMSVGWMERVNRRSRRDELLPGETVVVYAPRSWADTSSSRPGGPAIAPLPPIEPPQPDALPALSGAPAASDSG